MLQKAVMDYIRLTECLLLRKPGSYRSLKNAVLEYVRSCEAFTSFFFDDVRPALSPSAVKKMRDDVREDESQLYSRLETLSKQLGTLTLTLNKKTLDVEKPSMFCSLLSKRRKLF